MERRRERFEDVRRELEERRRRLEKLKERRTHALLLLRLCTLAWNVAGAARELEPLKPIREWLRKEPPIALLAVADRPMVVVEPETGAIHICGALCTGVGGPVGTRVWLLLANPGLSLLSDRTVRSTLAHELLHAAGIYSEDEADWRVDEAARLRPDLFSKIWYVRTGEALLALAAMDFLGADNIIIVPAEPRMRAAATLLFSASVKKPLAYCIERSA
ncbi:MAG: hypothetical protein QXT28_06210 [Thermofilaceae archaeon]